MQLKNEDAIQSNFYVSYEKDPALSPSKMILSVVPDGP